MGEWPIAIWRRQRKMLNQVQHDKPGELPEAERLKVESIRFLATLEMTSRAEK
jgi:hypothetical protein